MELMKKLLLSVLIKAQKDLKRVHQEEPIRLMTFGVLLNIQVCFRSPQVSFQPILLFVVGSWMFYEVHFFFQYSSVQWEIGTVVLFPCVISRRPFYNQELGLILLDWSPFLQLVFRLLFCRLICCMSSIDSFIFLNESSVSYQKKKKVFGLGFGLYQKRK